MKYKFTDKQLLRLIKENPMRKPKKKSIKIEGEIVDLSDLSNVEKQELKLREKVLVTQKNQEYPIVLVQLADGKVLMFDIEGNIKQDEENI